MNWTLLLAATSAIAVTQGLFLGISLLVKAEKETIPEFFLGLALLGIAIRIAKSLVYYFWQDMSLWGVAFGGAGLWLVGPAMWLFVLSQRYEKLSQFQYLHFLPTLILLFSGSFLGWSEMSIVYQAGTIQMFVYLLICLIQAFNWQVVSRNVTFYVLIAMILINGMFAFQLLSDSISSYAFGALFASVILYLLNYVIFKGFKSMSEKSKSRISEQKIELLGKVFTELQELFDQEGFYKESKLTLNKLAEKVERPPYLVRQAILQRHGSNFNDFVNQFRVDEVKRMLDENESHYTIEGMSQEVGFRSTSSFYMAFKKVLKCTPVEYKKGMLVK